ncbi:response regulator [Silvibacterium acidisoli]|uniref:response regulator n=1 Tax=Acidobacteriaceae bacterium ZG23-2 TaxID=2883246 RepID=UPI00406C05B8
MALQRKKTLLIADDHPLMAEGIARLLAGEYEIIGLSSNGRQLLTDAVALKPDMIVLDISMPDLNGIEAARRLREIDPAVKLIFVTQQLDPQYLKAAFRAGASAYVVKQSVSKELILAVRQVAMGMCYVTPFLEEAVGFAPVSELRRSLPQAGELTNRQREVLQLVAEGKSAREIASALNIACKTVEFHKKALMDQTGLRTTAELTRYAIMHGITPI